MNDDNFSNRISLGHWSENQLSFMASEALRFLFSSADPRACANDATN